MARFIPAEKLKSRYDIYGHFYTVELARKKVLRCRSVLEIIEPDVVDGNTAMISQRKPDAVFVMMNPGSSKPLVDVDNRIAADELGNLPISLVPTRPDTTQYQVMRLMQHCQWRHVRVLNLSDLRCTKSVEFFKQFRGLEADESFDSHSIFSSRRERELTAKLTTDKSLTVVCAWGLSPALDPLIERCTPRISQHQTIRGLLKMGTTNKYLHPLPSLQSQKLQWVKQMVAQCRSS